LITLMVCNDAWIHYSLVVWGGQLLNEIHHVSKMFMYKHYYTGSYSAATLVFWGIFHYFPEFALMQGYDYMYGMSLSIIVSIVSFLVFCLEVRKVPVKEYKSILITGGGRGIGAELMQMFANEDCMINICGRDIEYLNAVKMELEERGADVFVKAFDISDDEQLKRFMDDANNKRPLDLLICNACTKGTEQQQANVNLVATVKTLNRGLEIMKPGGVIAVMSSLGIFQTTPYDHFYMSIKRALYHYTVSAMPVAMKKGLKVIPVCPGMARKVPGTFAMTYRQAAGVMYEGLRKKRDYIIFPCYQRIALCCLGWLPGSIRNWLILRNL
jgi:short-subunit dehydrogenase